MLNLRMHVEALGQGMALKARGSAPLIFQSWLGYRLDVAQLSSLRKMPSTLSNSELRNDRGYREVQNLRKASSFVNGFR
jgi:hypothetical protein